MRCFYLLREEDVSGVSGVGVVADGVHFASGIAVLHWRALPGDTEPGAVNIYHGGVRQILRTHGHGGRTRVAWVSTGEVTA